MKVTDWHPLNYEYKFAKVHQSTSGRSIEVHTTHALINNSTALHW